MERMFNRNESPSLDDQKLLAKKFNINIVHINKWFESKRNIGGKNHQITHSEALEELENLFKSNEFPALSEQKLLAEKFNLNIYRIIKWFELRREEEVKSYTNTETSFCNTSLDNKKKSSLNIKFK
jgi:hypothetical protein